MVVKLTEQQYRWLSKAEDILVNKGYLNEDVYASDFDDRRKTVNLTYNKGGSSRKRNKYKGEFLKTDKMDANNNDTYIIPLKGGIMSYNITSISGTKVMHYFKNYFNGNAGKETIDVNGTDYRLEMERQEFNDFLSQFITKVSNVITHYVTEITRDNPNISFSTVSIYPVKSSSNFNVKMVDEIISNGLTLNGMNVRKVDTNILNKDTSELKKDEDFISKNQEYYNSRRSTMDRLPGTHMQALNTDINRLKSKNAIIPYINEINQTFNELYTSYHALKQRMANGQNIRQSSIQKIADLYNHYYELFDKIIETATYFNEITGKQQKQLASYNGEDMLYQQLKGSKPASINARTEELRNFLKGYIDKNNKYKDIGICQWQPVDFQIKKFTNDSRIALQNMFKFNDEKLKDEIEQIKNTILVIFDDNISGGATLSDICYQYKKLGITHIIPITFGKMKETWGGINKPENGFNY